MAGTLQPQQIAIYQNFLALLQSSKEIAHAAHLTASGDSFVSDHALYKELYEFLDDSFDASAERGVARCGGVIVDPVKIAELKLGVLQNEVNPVGRAPTYVAQGILRVIGRLVATTAQVYQQVAQGDVALDGFITSFAEKLDTFKYKVGQRVMSVSVGPAAPTPQRAVAHGFAAGLAEQGFRR